MTETPNIGREIVYLTDFDQETDKLAASYGTTPRYSTGDLSLDKYLGGGFGRPGAYEIVVLFGSTGIGKSTVALNFVLDPIQKGARVGLLMLEDDGSDVNAKMRQMLGKDGLAAHKRQIFFTPPDVVNGRKLWGLDDLLVLIEEWFMERKIDILVLDPIQFAFESAISIKGENEYVAQRIFVRKINYLMRKLGKTIILVTHVAKGRDLKGMDRILGSGGIAAAATKTIEIKREDGEMFMRFWKSRFTATPNHDRAFTFQDNHRLGVPVATAFPTR